MNLMILSPGRRVDIVEYFKKAINKVGGKVFTLDMSCYAPALYSGDKYFVIEKDFNNLDKYIDNVINICNKNDIKAVITLIDPELSLLAKNKEKFLQNNIIPIVSDYEEISNTFDKYEFANKMSNKLKVIPTYNSYDEAIKAIKDGKLNYPVFVKIRNGSGSEGIGKIFSNKELEAYKERENYIFQPCVLNKEFGVDMYFDMLSGKIVSLFIKEKLSMRAGETDKAISIYRQDIVNEVLKLEGMKFFGPIDVDVFEDKDGQLYINEINPRFGGGYPHAYNSGVNFMENIVNNLNGNENIRVLDKYEKGLVMMKYNSLLFMKSEEII